MFQGREVNAVEQGQQQIVLRSVTRNFSSRPSASASGLDYQIAPVTFIRPLSAALLLVNSSVCVTLLMFVIGYI